MKTLGLLALASIVSAAVPVAHGSDAVRTYDVTVTNLTRAQQFTQLLVATHRSSVRLFRVGQPASPELAILAEEGNATPLKNALDANPGVGSTAISANFFTNPGTRQTVRITTRPAFDRLSVAAMLIPTNDAFMALNGFELDELNEGERRVATVRVVAYDAGSERNDQLCTSIPGPSFAECRGPGGGAKVDGGEGFIHIHNGIHGGIGDLDAAQRTWLNPVAEITIRRVR